MHDTLINMNCYSVTEISCPALDIENGVIIYTGDTTEPYIYGTTAVYECNLGYEITNGGSERTCTGDVRSSVGEWSETTAVCSGIHMHAWRQVCVKGSKQLLYASVLIWQFSELQKIAKDFRWTQCHCCSTKRQIDSMASLPVQEGMHLRLFSDSA